MHHLFIPDTKRILTLSSCRDDEYTCRDGTCIRLDQNCDLRVECPDSSDESGCEKLTLPDEYIIRLPPPGLKENSPLEVNLSVSVTNFAEVTFFILIFLCYYKMFYILNFRF